MSIVRPSPSRRAAAGAALCVILAAACASDAPNAPPPPKADLPTFFAALPSWETFSPPLPAADAATGPASAGINKMIDSAQYACTTTPYSLTTTPEQVTTLNPDVEVLWVGALLQGDGHLDGIGSLAELPIRQRAPLVVSVDLLTGNTTRTVTDPTVATVSQAIGGLIGEASAAGHRAGSNIFYLSETAHSLEQASLKMGLSAKYMGASIKTGLAADMSNETRTVTAYFVQRMFTAHMVLPQHAEDVFSEAFTQEMLDREVANGRMGPSNLPVYVSSVAYGRILMFTMTSNSTESKIRATLNAMYNDGEFGGELDAELKQVLDNAQIRVVTVGGDADQALQLIRANDLSAYFSADAPLTTAKPISYSVRNLKDNSLARVSETTEYSLEQCTPVLPPAQVPTGARYRFILTKMAAEDLSWWEYGNHALIQSYDFRVEDGDGIPRAAAWKTWRFNGASAVLDGGQHIFTQIDTIEADIHFDGRDAIRVYGQMSVSGAAISDRVLEFSRTYRWPNAQLPTHGSPGTSTTTHTTTFYGSVWRLHWSWQRILTLYD